VDAKQLTAVGVVAVVAMTVLSVNAGLPGTRWLTLAPGQTSITVSGHFNRSDGIASFFLKARAQQHLTLRVEPLGPKLITAGLVVSPSGSTDGGPGGLIFDDDLSETGVYRIVVEARQHSGPGTFRIRIELFWPHRR
jgi:hypothetical protein